MLWTVEKGAGDQAADDQGAGDTAEITQQIKRLQVTLTSPTDPPLTYDSADEKRPTGAARQLESSLKPLLAAQYRITMNDRGEVLAAKMVETAGEPKDEKQTADKNPVSGDTVQQLLKQPLVVLPEKDVSAGDTWKTETQTTTPLGKLRQTTTSTLRDIAGEGQDQTATIAQSAELQLEPTNKKLQLTSHELEGTVRFAIGLGRVTSVERTQQLRTESPYRETTIAVDLRTRLSTHIEPVAKEKSQAKEVQENEK
jgi:hypothetical protein